MEASNKPRNSLRFLEQPRSFLIFVLKAKKKKKKKEKRERKEKKAKKKKKKKVSKKNEKTLGFWKNQEVSWFFFKKKKKKKKKGRRVWCRNDSKTNKNRKRSQKHLHLETQVIRGDNQAIIH